MFYAKSPDRFESAASQGLFARCGGLEVWQVSDLKLSVALAETSRVTTADIASRDETVFIRAGTRSVTDQLASELCKLLEAPEDLADLFARVLMAQTADDADDFLRIRRIGQLPADLVEGVSGRGGSLPVDQALGDEVVADDTGKEAGDTPSHSATENVVPDADSKHLAESAKGRVSEPTGADSRTPLVSGQSDQRATSGESGSHVPPATPTPESSGSSISTTQIPSGTQQASAEGGRKPSTGDGVTKADKQSA